MRTTITNETELDIVAEFDAEYVRDSDDQIRDLDLCFLWVKAQSGSTFDLLKGVSFEAKQRIQANLLAVPGFSDRLYKDFETIAEDLQIEIDFDPHTLED